MTKKKSTETFESQLEKLESIVESMESGELPLDEALKQFEQGIKLTNQCQQMLENAKQRVRILTEDQQLTELEVEVSPENSDSNS